MDGAGMGLSLDVCRNLAGLGEAEAAACASADARGLQWSIIVFVCLYAWAALHFFLAGRTLQRDMVARSA